MKIINQIGIVMLLLVILPIVSLYGKEQQENEPTEAEIEQMFHAIRKSNVEDVKQCVEANPKLVHAREIRHYGTPLHTISHNNSALEIVETLVKNGADVNARNEYERTPLHNIVGSRADMLDVLKCLLNNGADVNAVNRNGRTPIFNISLPIHLKYLVKHGADLKRRDPDGNTVLHASVPYKDMEIVEFLLESGAEVNAQNKSGETALHILANQFVHLSKLEPYFAVFHEHGADFTIKNNDGVSPLDILLDNEKFQPSIKEFFEKTPEVYENHISYAVMTGNLEAVRRILERFPEMVRTRNSIQRTPLHDAAKKNNLPIVKLLIESGADIHAKTEDGGTALHESVRTARNTDTIGFLLDCGADIEARDNIGNTPIHAATQHNNIFEPIFKYLLERKADVYVRNYQGHTPCTIIGLLDRRALVLEVVKKNPRKGIFDFVRIGDLETVRKIVASEPELIHVKGEVGETLLHWATLIREPIRGADKLEMIEYLLEKGCDVNAVNDYGQTPLCYAVSAEYVAEGDYSKKNDAQVVETLIKHGADTKITLKFYASVVSKAFMEKCPVQEHLKRFSTVFPEINDDEFTLLHIAALGNVSNEIIKSLLNSGIDVSVKTREGFTALHFAGYNGALSMIEYLVSLGAEINAKSKADFTPLHLSVCTPYANTCRKLISLGADPNATDEKYGDTPLHVVILAKHAPYFNQYIPLLPENGADVNRKDRSGNTPLHLVAKVDTGYSLFAEYDVFKSLIRYGADINAKNNQGLTPLELIEDSQKKKVFLKSVETQTR